MSAMNCLLCDLMSAILTLRMLFPINGRSEKFDSNVRNELDWPPWRQVGGTVHHLHLGDDVLYEWGHDKQQ